MLSYLKLLHDVLQNGQVSENRTGVKTRAVFGYQWHHYMMHGFPLLTTKRIPFRWVKEELRWMLIGSTDAWELSQLLNVPIWDPWATVEQCAKFNRKQGQLGCTYGELLTRFPIGPSESDGNSYPSTALGNEQHTEYVHGSTDQIWQLIKNIQEDPDSRRLIVTLWHPYYSRRVAVPPCQLSFQINCYTDKLAKRMDMRVTSRSSDAFLGLPFDIASYGLLLELLGRVTGYLPNKLIFQFGDLHIYENHLDQVNEQLQRVPTHLPELLMSEKLCNSGFDGLNRWAANCDFDLYLGGYNPQPSIPAPIAV